MLDVVHTLSQLVAIPSVNPMGGIAAGPYCGEAALSDYLEALFRRIGLDVVRQSIGPGQDNLVARLDGSPSLADGGRLVLVDAHQDTVPVGGMTIDPFRPEIRDGRLFGRGSCDVKGGMAALLAGVARLAGERPQPRPTVVMTCTVNEEHGFTGAMGITQLWTRESGGLIPRRPDIALVAEPTGLDVVVAHKGVIRWRCHTRGRAAHSSKPELGDNAIYKMGRVLVCLDRYQRDVVGQLASHPLCGPATFSVGLIRGGVSVNTVPDRCTVEIDRRLPPGEDAESARRHLAEYLAAQPELDFPVEQDPPDMQGPPLSDAHNGPYADLLCRVSEQVTGRCRQIGVPYATNAALFAQAGVPAVVCGPGLLAQAHTVDEWIEIRQLEQAAEVYFRFLRDLGASPLT